MDPELKAKWVAALRSGEYKQARGQLRQGDAYCCLGVLCELDPLVVFDDLNNALLQGGIIGFGGLEPEARNRFGIPVRVERRLIELNDGEGPDQANPRDFNQIANWIEKSRQL